MLVSFDRSAGLVYSGLCHTRFRIVCIFKGAFAHVHSIVLVEIILIPRNIGVKNFLLNAKMYQHDAFYSSMVLLIVVMSLVSP